MMNAPFRTKTLDRQEFNPGLMPARRVLCRLQYVRLPFWKISWAGSLAALVLLSCTLCFAIDEDDDEPAEVRIEPRFRMTGQHFDQLVFGGTVVVERENGKTITRSPNKLFRPNLENAYAKEIEQLAKECKLSDEQRKKLQLAARGDVVRLMNRIDVLRQKTINTELSQAEYPALVSELQGFSFASRLMISNPSSLFRKSLRRCLTDEQVVLYAAAEHNRQIAMLERALDQLGRPSASGNFIESSLDQLEEELMPRKLTPEARRKKFVEIMLANTRIPPASHPYAIQIIFLEAGKQEELLEPVFTQSQWENFQRQVKNARRVENGLQLMGVWPLRTRDEEAELGDEDGN